jgi:sporulation protein YlmC with PRC-barrel domain
MFIFKKLHNPARCLMMVITLGMFALPVQAQAQNMTGDEGSDVAEIIRMLLPSLTDNKDRNTPSFYRPVVKKNEVEGSFVDLTYQSIKGNDGETVGLINDILVDPETGKADKIIYTRPDTEDQANPKLSSVDYRYVLVQEQDGDIQVNIDGNVLKNSYEFKYTPDILKQYISLKYLRQGDVIDDFDKTVGRIIAVIYRNNKIEQIYVALSKNLASGKDRLFSVPFEAAHIIHEQDGFDLHLTKAQTESLAAQLYTYKKTPLETSEALSD